MNPFTLMATAVALLWLPMVASAQSADDDARACYEQINSAPDLAIGSCSREIDSGRLSQESLVIAFYNRGSARDNKKDFDRAVADYDQAIQINPQYVLN